MRGLIIFTKHNQTCHIVTIMPRLSRHNGTIVELYLCRGLGEEFVMLLLVIETLLTKLEALRLNLGLCHGFGKNAV